MAFDPTSLCALEPEVGVAFENGRTVATSAEPWLRFKSLAPFEASRFVEITYRASLYDDPVRPILRFVTASGETDRILPGPVAGAGIWRGAAPKDLRSVLINPATRLGRFDFIVENVRPLKLSEVVALVWAKRPRKMFDIVLAASFGYFAEAENAVAWAIGAEPLACSREWRALRERPADPAGLDAPRTDWRTGPACLVVIDAHDATRRVARAHDGFPASAVLRKFQGGHRRVQAVGVISRPSRDPSCYRDWQGKAARGRALPALASSGRRSGASCVRAGDGGAGALSRGKALLQ